MPLSLNHLESAALALSRAVRVTQDAAMWKTLVAPVQEAVQAGVIQSFEVAYEQSWKMMKRWLETNASPLEVDGVSRRQLFRLAAEAGLIAEVDVWMLFHKARNETSHTYDIEKAQAVLEMVQPFLIECNALISVLKAKND